MKAVLNRQTGEVVEYTDAEFIIKRDQLLFAWQDAKQVLERAKERELELRNQCVDFLSDPDKTKGTENVELGGGYKAKMIKKENISFVKNEEGKVDKNAIEKALQKIEKDGAVGELIAERLVKWTPDLSMTEYKQLSEKHKNIIDSVIITTPGTPTLEIVEPKNK